MNTSRRCAGRKRIFPPCPSNWRWKWIICRGTRTGSRNWRARHPWDYFIGSVHYVADSWALDNPEDLRKWTERDPFEVWSVYFERLGLAAESELFEIIGHADLPKKFKIYPKQDVTPIFERFLDKAAKSDVAIELNTAGLAQGLPGDLPEPDVFGAGGAARRFPSPSGRTRTRRARWEATLRRPWNWRGRPATPTPAGSTSGSARKHRL